ncbi:hypothetical protein RvVAT039_pl12750 (plasmid) [Agrobacterium vitis]|uniref:helix-turn-helix domain-containing protein n=1 Tax=Agrobacterium vitis TaxID=373 RepID=UPI0015DA1641|nr:helix-turn-helix transcriptional regulator [Agrobacterium vitis]BCH68442.1 hypothetical protein RvVAT039_pl12750 [Agrobacterium vitis]
MVAGKKRRIETELGEFIVLNLAAVMEREREKHGLGKVEFAKFCQITAPSYLTILDGTANPTIYIITRISNALGIPVQELLFDAPKKERSAKRLQ